jgi:hypothetical protein
MRIPKTSLAKARGSILSRDRQGAESAERAAILRNNSMPS